MLGPSRLSPGSPRAEEALVVDPVVGGPHVSVALEWILNNLPVEPETTTTDGLAEDEEPAVGRSLESHFG